MTERVGNPESRPMIRAVIGSNNRASRSSASKILPWRP